MKNLFWLLILITFTQCDTKQAPVHEANRIVSLANSITMNLYFLNAQDKLVGCTSYCESAKKDKKEIVANAIKVNIEKIVSLKPDLVLATTLTNPETIETIKKLGIRVEIIKTAKSYTEICTQFKQLGKLVGKEQTADSILNNSKARIDSLKKQIPGNISQKIFFQIGSKPLFTVIPNTYMNDFISFMNGENIASDLTRGSINRESVLTRNPDAIFIITMGIVSDEEKSIWESYKSLSATQKKQIFIIDSNLACTATPITFVQTLETMFNQLYPKR